MHRVCTLGLPLLLLPGVQPFSLANVLVRSPRFVHSHRRATIQPHRMTSSYFTPLKDEVADEPAAIVSNEGSQSPAARNDDVVAELARTDGDVDDVMWSLYSK